MNVQRAIASFLAVGLLGVGAVQAGPVIGTAKARGDFQNFTQTQHGARQRQVHYYRAPAMASAPVIVQAPAVAQAPNEARRFSYAPESTTATAEPAAASQGSYSAPSSYSRITRGAATADRWALPKTSPWKFNGR